MRISGKTNIFSNSSENTKIFAKICHLRLVFVVDLVQGRAALGAWPRIEPMRQAGELPRTVGAAHPLWLAPRTL